MNKNKIIDLWKQAGWNNVADYHNDISVKSCRALEYQDLTNLLNPCKVSPKTFWKATDEWFKTDTVCNTLLNKDKNDSISKANFENNKIALYSGLLGLVEWGIANCNFRFGATSIGEIGCGYGSFYEHFAKDRTIRYVGFDVVKRFDKCVEVKGRDGTFTKTQIKEYKNKINLFYSCNVFQHLVPNIIEKYIKQAYEILPVGGVAVFAYINAPEPTISFHYGQIVDIMPTNDFYEMCEALGFTIETKIEQKIKGNKTFNLACVYLTKF